MPFALVNAPATFSRLMRSVLRNSSGLDNYLDDKTYAGKKYKKIENKSFRCEVGIFDIGVLDIDCDQKLSVELTDDENSVAVYTERVGLRRQKKL